MCVVSCWRLQLLATAPESSNAFTVSRLVLPLATAAAAPPSVTMRDVRQGVHALRAVSEGGVQLPNFRWDVWWTNAVFMGVQTGDTFGEHFVKAAELEAPWRRGVVTALAREALPPAWLPTVAEAAGGGGETARDAGCAVRGARRPRRGFLIHC